MLRTYVVCYLLLISCLSVRGTEDKEKSFLDSPWCWVPAVAGGAVVGAVFAPWALGAGLAGMGFTGTGITAGSLAAGAMSTAATTGVGAGLVAVAQSAGAAGVALGTKTAMAAGGAIAGYFSSGCKEPNC
ncbi:interferon alpha-inducible protein 27-like protein 2A isoform X5 [Haliotis rubra]|uniref:interferon alpha-inducible protein 27-like protein 2A isoform X5 n=1 Tax=Haliotis rubra TaxID=36100 RepID=UPI001EE5870D|nr:interferon alpha-inducible protein 27-like protein 2A isoform X5 [Haliotis rubra]